MDGAISGHGEAILFTSGITYMQDTTQNTPTHNVNYPSPTHTAYHPLLSA